MIFLDRETRKYQIPIVNRSSKHLLAKKIGSLLEPLLRFALKMDDHCIAVYFQSLKFKTSLE